MVHTPGRAVAPATIVPAVAAPATVTAQSEQLDVVAAQLRALVDSIDRLTGSLAVTAPTIAAPTTAAPATVTAPATAAPATVAAPTTAASNEAPAPAALAAPQPERRVPAEPSPALLYAPAAERPAREQDADDEYAWPMQAQLEPLVARRRGTAPAG